MIKDFVPASSTLDTGIIIKPHVLDRSKAKTPEMSGTRPEYSASIDTAFVTGSQAGAYDNTSITYTTSHSLDINTMSGSVVKPVIDESPMYNGELSSSLIEITDGELNDENIFKKVNVPVLNFDIIPIDEGSANYTAFNIDVDVFNDATASCGSSFSGVQRFHSGTGATPAVNDFVFNDASGNQTFNVNSAAKWYKIQDGKSILIQGTSAGSNQGKVTEVADCSQFDEDPPAGYSATWNLTSGKINANNKTAVPFFIYDGELDATFEVTASRESGGQDVKITGTITNAVTQSGTIDVTNVPDGDNILLDVRLVDATGNVGAFATNKGNVANTIDNTLTASIKDVVAPSITGVDFKTNNSYNVNATATNTDGILYIRVAGIPNNERGSINMTITSTGGGSTFTDTRGYNNLSTHTANQDYLLTSFQHGLSNGTLTVTVSLTDFAGNSSINYTDTLVMNVQSGGIVTSNTKSASSGNHALAITVFPTTISWSLSKNQTWTTISNNTGTGNATKYIYFQNNSSSSSRTVTVTLKNSANNTILDTQTITQAGTYNSCVAPHTLITMGDGSYKTAGRLSVGDEIKTKHENTLEQMNALVYEKKSSHSKRIKVFIGDKDIVVSPAHRFYVDNRSEFVAAEDLKEGDILSGKDYIKTEEYEDGEVLQISVEKAHTYISNDILSHNTKGVDDYDS